MIKLASPNVPETAINKVEEVLRSGNLVQGKYVHEFENSLKDYLDVEHAIVVSSGTAALHLSLLALGIGKGDEVIVPAFSFPATANVVELVGAKPVFVDITLVDLCIDTSKIENAITKSTKAIMPVHEFGQSANMKEIMDIAHEYGLFVIEDGACALGTEFGGKKVGTFGIFGCYSLHPRKATTTGEGGIIVTQKDRLAKTVKALRNHGISYNQNDIEFTHAGLNYRMTEFQAVMGNAQMVLLEKLIKQRNHIASLYENQLRRVSDLLIPRNISNRSNTYQTYHIILDGKYDRREIIFNLLKRGVETNLGAHAIPLIKFYRDKYEIEDNKIVNAVKAYRQGLALPIGSHINEKKVERIVSALKMSLHY